MPKISPQWWKVLKPPVDALILKEFIRFFFKGEGHVILRMEENKQQVCVKCKRSLDVALFDGFKHRHACR